MSKTRVGAGNTHQWQLTRWSCLCHVRAAGSWRAYVRLPREEVLRLRSLVIRGRARPRVRTRAADPVVARVVLLPNELVWKVLAYWRCGVI